MIRYIIGTTVVMILAALIVKHHELKQYDRILDIIEKRREDAIHDRRVHYYPRVRPLVDEKGW